MNRDERLQMLRDRRADFAKRYDEGNGETMVQIANTTGVSRARISQCIKRAKLDAQPVVVSEPAVG